jgi:signal transduction histidine kinase
VQELMHEVIEEGRGVLGGLRASDGGADDLLASLSRVPGELGIEGAAPVRIVMEGTARPLHPAVRDDVYRIAREALVNSLRHSGARNIDVELEYGTRHLRIVVRDDGKGIEPDLLREGRGGHWGLSGIRERAGKLGGELALRSRVGAGTEIELVVPNRVAFEDASSRGAGLRTRLFSRGRSIGGKQP